MRAVFPLLTLSLPVLLGLGGCGTMRGTDPTPVSPPASAARLEATRGMGEALSRAVADKRVRGGVVWWQQGDAVAVRAEGWRAVSPESERMTRDTLFDAASLTKVIATTTAVMQLVERGKLNLDAPADTYLPGLRAGKVVTLRQLMTHTSGLPAGINPAGWQGHARGIKLAEAAALEDQPGEVFRYSDINYILLGAMVEKVDGRRLDRYCEEEVFQPLGMTDTAFGVPEAKVARTAPTAPDKKGGWWRGVVHDACARNMEGVAGHAGLFTTASDLSRFARMLLGGGELDGRRVLSEASVREMTRPQLAPVLAVQRGLGWDIDTPHSGPRGSLYPPLKSFGHTGFTGTSLWVDPASGSFVILLTSRLHPDGKGDTGRLRAEMGTLAAEAAGLGRPMLR